MPINLIYSCIHIWWSVREWTRVLCVCVCVCLTLLISIRLQPFTCSIITLRCCCLLAAISHRLYSTIWYHVVWVNYGENCFEYQTQNSWHRKYLLFFTSCVCVLFSNFIFNQRNSLLFSLNLALRFCIPKSWLTYFKWMYHGHFSSVAGIFRFAFNYNRIRFYVSLVVHSWFLFVSKMAENVH